MKDFRKSGGYKLRTTKSQKDTDKGLLDYRWRTLGGQKDIGGGLH